MIETLVATLILLGLCVLISSFAIITFIVVALFFKKEICFHEKNKLILSFELFLILCGWLAIGFILLLIVATA
jgi:hypothetical protein